jgi:chitodextrinase
LAFEQLESRLLLAGTFVDTGFTFGDATVNSKAAWADFDNDGYADLHLNGVIWHNDAGTGFTRMAGIKPIADVNPTLVSTDAVLGDFNNDGLVDVFFYVTLDLYQNVDGTSFVCANHLLPTMSNNNSVGAAWGDLNGDGYLDLYIGGEEEPNFVYHPDRILMNNQGQGFSLAWEQASGFQPARGITMADFDEDNDLDIYVSNYRLEPNQLWENNGLAAFTNAGPAKGVDGLGPYPYGHTIGSAWGDVDSDGDIDLFVGNFRHPTAGQDHSRFYENLGSASGWTFADHSLASLWQESYATPALADYDNDGDLDLFFTTVYGGDNPRLLENTGGWNFANVTSVVGLAGLGSTYQASWADYDNDGDLDLMTDGKLFRNVSVNSNNWLKVHLTGDGINVNSSAIGAQVRADLGGGTIVTRQVEAGTGKGNQNDLTLQFGLGTFSGTVALEIRWGDGTTDNYLVSPNQTLSYTYAAPLVADAYEANDSSPAAYALGSSDITVSDLSIHAAGNDDWFSWTATAAGVLTVDIVFDHALGNLDLELRDAGGQLDLSSSTTNSEQVSANVTSGQTHFIRVFGAAGATNSLYELDIDGPGTEPTRPSNLAASIVSHERTDLSWTASTDDVGVTGYDIFRNGVNIATVTSTSYSDTGLDAITPYTYEVEAVDGLANRSGRSVPLATVSGELIPGLIGYWRFEEGAGSVVSDSSGHGNHGTRVNDATWVPGILGTAAYLSDPPFSGDAYIRMGSTCNDFNFNNKSFSISLWTNDIDSLGQKIAKGKGGPQGWSIHGTQFNVGDSSGSVEYAYFDSRPAGTWTHLVATLDTDTRTIQLYQDGAPVYTRIIGSSLDLVNIDRPVQLLIGATEEGQAPFYTGTIDEVSIFNRVLTPAEATAMAAISPQQPNTAPVVDAGPDLQVFTPADSIAIDATVTDDGIPIPASAPITVWTKISGPGEVTFDDLASIDTTAHFSALGTYVLRLTADDHELTSYDEVTVYYVAGNLDPDDYEPNDTSPTATDLGNYDVALTTGLNIHDAVDIDWFTWTAIETGPLTVDVLFAHAVGDLDLELYDSGGLLQLSNSATDNEQVSTTVTNGETYRLRVFGVAGKTNPSYELHLNGPGVDPDAYEPNDSSPAAYNLGTIDDASLADLSIHQPDNDDWFTWTAEADGELTVDALFSHAGGDLTLELYDSGGLVDSSTTATDNEQVTTTLIAGQTYRVRVFGAASATQADYDLVIDGQTNPPTLPGNLQAFVVSSSQIELAWIPSTDNVAVAGYDVFRGGVVVATVTDPVYSDSGLTTDFSYNYAVEAFDGEGYRSGQTAPVIVATPPLIDGLLGYWRFEDGVGSTATDLSGNGFNGTLSGDATWAAGKLGGGISFDGDGDWVDMGDAPEFNFNNQSFSFAYWTNNMGAVPGLKFGKGNGGPQGWGTSQTQFGIGYGIGGFGGAREHFYYPNNYANGTWTHLAMTLDFPTRTVRLYQDGVPVPGPAGSRVLPGSFDLNDINVVGAPLMLGTTMSGQLPYYTGTLDEVYLFDRTLGAIDIATLAAVSPPNQAPVVDAGPMQSYPESNSAVLDGTVTDDGSPNPLTPTAIYWSKVSGLGYVTFDDPTDVDTTAHFSQPGTYVLQLWASDGELSIADTVTFGNVSRIPTVPPSLSAAAVLPTRVDLSWQIATDDVAVTGYDVFRNSVKIATVADNVYSDTTASPQTGYSYQVEALDGDGNRSGLSAPAVAVTPAASGLIDGLLGYWKLDDAGSTATDSSGNGFNGTLAGNATWDTGKLGGGISFDGDRDWVDMGNLPEFNFNNQSFSFAYWTNNMGATPGLKFGKGNGGPRGWGTSQQQFGIGYGIGGFGGAREYLYYQNNTPNGVWTHLAMTLDFPARTVRLYQDGVPVPGATGSLVLPGSFDLNDINEPTAPLMLGTAMSGQLPYYAGTLDEVYLFDRALDASEVSALAAINPPNTAPVVNAGADQQIAATDIVVVDATATDDGLPTPLIAPTTIWTKITGPGAVTFGDPTAVHTTVQLSTAGTYVLRLTADDGLLSTYDELTVESIAVPDFNGSGTVDGGDFLAWQRGHGSGTTFAEGDANGDMVVDGLDLSIWENSYGSTVVAAATGSVATGSATSGVIDEPSGVSANLAVSAAPFSASMILIDPLMFTQPTDPLAGPTLATPAYDSSSDTPIALDSDRASQTKLHPQHTLTGDIDRHLARLVHDNRPDRLQGLDSDALWNAAVDQFFRDDPEWLTWPLLQ